MSFESQSEQELRRRSREAGGESKENREGGEGDAELQKATAMEKADIIVKEVKTSKKQMQNIALHMQTVMQTIRQLRAQLQLAQTDDDVSSVKQDKKNLASLRLKIKEYIDEIEKMRADLIREQMNELKNGIGVGMTSEQLQRKAEELVQQLIDSAKE